MPRKKNLRKKRQPLDLLKVNPRGRLDVLAASAIDKFTQRVPELRPIVDEHKEVIHASLNSQLGPHAVGFDLIGLVDAAQPYLPLLGRVLQTVVQNYNAARIQQQNSSDESKGKNAA